MGAFKERNSFSFKSVFVPILTCGHESYTRTERILSKEQMVEMGYLRRLLGVTLRDKDHRSEIPNPRCQATCPNREIPAIRPCVQIVPGKNSELSHSGYSLYLHPQESGPKFVHGLGGVTPSLT